MPLLIMMVFYSASARTFSQPEFQHVILKRLAMPWEGEEAQTFQHRIRKRMAMPWGPPSGSGPSIQPVGPPIQVPPAACVVCDDYGGYDDGYDIYYDDVNY